MFVIVVLCYQYGLVSQREKREEQGEVMGREGSCKCVDIFIIV